MKHKRYYEIKWIKNILFSLSLLLIVTSNLDVLFQVMLAFGYFMLFRQERWHKHLLIMSIMLLILFVATNYLTHGKI